MKLFPPPLSARIMAFAIGIGLLLVIIFGGLRACQEFRNVKAQSKVDRGQAGAFRNSASDAVDTIGDVSSNQAAGVEIGRRNEEEIRNAKGADQRVDPAANAAGLRALCRRRSHRDDPACRVRQPDPK